jgi:hypothetical protein
LLTSLSTPTLAVSLEEEAQMHRLLCNALKASKTRHISRRALSDASLNAIEDYAKIVATTEAIAASALAISAA